MSLLKFKIAVPATTMIAGEHAVVYQGGAIACALNTFMHFSWTTTESQAIKLVSNLGHVVYDLKTKSLSSQEEKWRYFKLILDDLSQYHSLNGGVLQIHSEFSSEHGLGSSSAFVVGMLKVMNKLYQFAKDNLALLRIALSITRKFSPLASGTDIVACIYDGVIYANLRQNIIEKINFDEKKVTLAYCGYKTPTPVVLRRVEQNLAKEAKLHKALNAISHHVDLIKDAMILNQHSDLEVLMFEHHRYLKELGVVDKNLEDIYKSMSQDSCLCGAKVSGSGLGDSVISFGQTQGLHTQQLPGSFQKTYDIYNSQVYSLEY